VTSLLNNPKREGDFSLTCATTKIRKSNEVGPWDEGDPEPEESPDRMSMGLVEAVV